MLVGVDYFAVGHKSEFNERLETVTDSAHKTVTTLKKFGNALFYLGISEEGCYEFAASVGLVSARESARDKYYLRILERIREFFDTSLYSVCREVVYNYYLRLESRIGNRFCGIVFTVSSRESGDKNFGFCGLYCGRMPLVNFIFKFFNLLVLTGDIATVNAFEFILISRENCF